MYLHIYNNIIQYQTTSHSHCRLQRYEYLPYFFIIIIILMNTTHCASVQINSHFYYVGCHGNGHLLLQPTMYCRVCVPVKRTQQQQTAFSAKYWFVWSGLGAAPACVSHFILPK